MAVTMKKLKEYWMIVAIIISFFTWIVAMLSAMEVTLAVLDTKIDNLSYRIERIEGGLSNGPRG